MTTPLGPTTGETGPGSSSSSSLGLRWNTLLALFRNVDIPTPPIAAREEQCIQIGRQDCDYSRYSKGGVSMLRRWSKRHYGAGKKVEGGNQKNQACRSANSMALKTAFHLYVRGPDTFLLHRCTCAISPLRRFQRTRDDDIRHPLWGNRQILFGLRADVFCRYGVARSQPVKWCSDLQFVCMRYNISKQ